MANIHFIELTCIECNAFSGISRTKLSLNASHILAVEKMFLGK